ncbi:MAG: efflux RND transporter periplasmic adaptor subunit, partial [Flavobacteriaceae bacterium]
LNNMYVESDMPENYLASIRIGSPATVSIPVLSETQTTTIRQTGNFIQPNNRTFRVEAAIQNPNKIIKPNLNARLSIVDYSNPEALMIPLRVIRENANGDPYVFILINGQTEADQNVQQRFITLGKSKNEKVEILAGIEAGELIIDEGVSLLVNDQKVTLIED